MVSISTLLISPSLSRCLAKLYFYSCFVAFSLHRILGNNFQVHALSSFLFLLSLNKNLVSIYQKTIAKVKRKQQWLDTRKCYRFSDAGPCTHLIHFKPWLIKTLPCETTFDCSVSGFPFFSDYTALLIRNLNLVAHKETVVVRSAKEKYLFVAQIVCSNRSVCWAIIWNRVPIRYNLDVGFFHVKQWLIKTLFTTKVTLSIR